MKKEQSEKLENPVNEARRYVNNARDILLKRGKYDLETNHYGDRKYVKAAGHYLWSGVLVILDATFNINRKKDERVDIKDYRLAVGTRDRKLLALVNDAYDTLHLHMGYDGVLNKKICDEGFLIANEIIDRCAVMLPVSPAA